MHVARMGEIQKAHKILVGNLRVRDYSEDLGKDYRITLKWMLKKL